MNGINFSDYFEYSEDSPSGLVWKVTRNSRALKGKSCGNIKGNGYYQTGLFGKYYGNHVIIWKLLKGDIPKGMVIDHIDNNNLNNKISNLRVTTIAGNTRNRKPLIGKTSKFKGVCWNKLAKKWKVKIVVDYKDVHLGYFDDELEAADIYKQAAEKYYGDFAYHVN